jgi:hypothetical protein
MTERVPLAEQLDELAAEYTRRCRAYPLLVARGEMRQTAMELKIERLEAAHHTLAWLYRNAAGIKEWLLYMRKVSPTAADFAEVAMGAPPDVDPIIEPDDAEVIDVPKGDLD